MALFSTKNNMGKFHYRPMAMYNRYIKIIIVYIRALPESFFLLICNLNQLIEASRDLNNW